MKMYYLLTDPTFTPHELKERWGFDFDKDMVVTTFYMGYESEQFKVGEFISIDKIGEYLLEQYTVKAFKFEIENNKRTNDMIIKITIVLNKDFN